MSQSRNKVKEKNKPATNSPKRIDLKKKNMKSPLPTIKEFANKIRFQFHKGPTATTTISIAMLPHTSATFRAMKSIKLNHDTLLFSVGKNRHV